MKDSLPDTAMKYSANHNTAHQRYLDVYYSQKIRMCLVDLEGKFQTNLYNNHATWKNQVLTFANLVC